MVLELGVDVVCLEYDEFFDFLILFVFMKVEDEDDY